jgi:hypothetical protein
MRKTNGDGVGDERRRRGKGEETTWETGFRVHPPSGPAGQKEDGQKKRRSSAHLQVYTYIYICIYIDIYIHLSKIEKRGG